MPPPLRKRCQHAGDNPFEFITAREPAKGVVDPCHEFPGRVQQNNGPGGKL